MSALRKASRMPVFVFLSAFVNALSGNGRSFGVAAACAEAGRGAAASARGRSRFTAANLHGVGSRVHALLRAALRLRGGHRGAASAVPSRAPRALPGLAGGPAASGWRGGGGDAGPG